MFRHISTSAGRPAWFLMSPLGKALVALGARAGRGLWKGWSRERRARVKEAIRRRSGYIYGGIGIGFSCCVGYYYYHIEETPVTKRRRFMMINRQRLLEMIQEEQKELLSSLTMGHQVLPPTHPDYDKIIPILKRIISVLNSQWIGQSDMKEIHWTLYVLDSPDIANAICLPSGQIFVHSGLLKICQNEHELAFILSHEVAHVLMNHGGEVLSNRGLVNFFHLFVIAALWAIVPNDLVSFFLHKWSHSLAEVLFHLPYSRELEEEADKVGFLLASSACYVPIKSMQIWSHFPSSNAGELPEYFSTHPVNEYRLEALKKLLPDATKMWKENGCQSIQKSDFVNNFHLRFPKVS